MDWEGQLEQATKCKAEKKVLTKFHQKQTKNS